MKMKNLFFVITIGMVLSLISACAPQATPIVLPEPTQTLQAAATAAGDTKYYFVTNKLLLPTNQTQTQDFALNIDEDVQNNPDNKFGELLTLLGATAPDLDLQTTFDQALTSGQLVSLHVVETSDLVNDPDVLWSLFVGQPTQSAPSFSGSDQLAIDPAIPAGTPINGSLVNGHFSGGPGTTHVQMVLMGQMIDVDLIGVHLEADVTAQGCTNGKIGGGITSEQLRGNLLPAMAEGLNQIIAANQSAGSALLSILDSDANGSVTAQELENNPLLMLVISPDLDLLDGSGNFNPDQDGVKDSYSAGLGFSCVPATFTAPS